MSELKSEKLRELLTPKNNKTKDNREEVNMAKDLNALTAQKAKKEEAEAKAKAAKEQQEAETKSEQTTTDNEEVAKDNTKQTATNGDKSVKDDSEKTPEELAEEMDALLEQSKKTREQQQQQSGNNDKTNLFPGTGNTGDNKIDDNLSDEEKQKAADNAKKQEAALQREREIQERNAKIQNAYSRLENSTKTKQITPEQKNLQIACSNFYTLDGLIVETAPAPEVSVTKVYKKVDKKFVKKKGVDDQLLVQYAEGTDPKLKKENLYQYDTNIVYRYKKPGAIVGAVLTLPSNLAFTVNDFKSNNFTVPGRSEIESADKITAVVDFDTAYIYTLLFCGGKIKEHPSLRNGKFEGAKVSNKITATVKIVTKDAGTAEKRIFKAETRSSLLVKENIIPIKVFETVNLANLASDTETKLGMYDALKKALSKKDNVKDAPVTALGELASKLISYKLDAQGQLDTLNVDFLEGKATLGAGDFSALTLRDWSDCQLDKATNKRIYSPVVGNPVVRLSQNQNQNDPTKISYKKVQKVLAKDLTLDELAITYPAAGIVRDLGVSALEIFDIYSNYLVRKKALREEAARNSNTSKKHTKVESGVISNDLASRLVSDMLTGNNEIKLDMDADAIADAITQTVYRPVSK